MPPLSGFAISTLTSADASLLDELMSVFASAFDDPESYARHRPGDAYRKRLLASPAFIALVAMKGGAVVGGLTAYRLEKPEQERAEIYIYDLAVAEGHRREGIATGLINELKAIARARRAYVVFVQADLGDDAAIALYTKLGSREDVLHFDIDPDAP